MIAPHLKTGMLGEVAASRYLRDNGYEILSANFRTKAGEIDVVARKDDIICFVEVKTRQSGTLFRPAEAVDADKQARIRASAKIYMKAAHLEDNISLKQRFDIIEVVAANNEYKCNHIINAY